VNRIQNACGPRIAAEREGVGMGQYISGLSGKAVLVSDSGIEIDGGRYMP